MRMQKEEAGAQPNLMSRKFRPGCQNRLRGVGVFAKHDNLKPLARLGTLFACSALIGVTTSCHQATSPAGATPSPSVTSTGWIARQSRYALWCRALNGTVGPPSYLARDVGKPGVPVLNAKQSAELRDIAGAAHSPTLRFAFLNSVVVVKAFIIYDGDGNPCNGGPDFQVYNQDCRTGYDPEDVPYNTIALPYCATRPWNVRKAEKQLSK